MGLIIILGALIVVIVTFYLTFFKNYWYGFLILLILPLTYITPLFKEYPPVDQFRYHTYIHLISPEYKTNFYFASFNTTGDKINIYGYAVGDTTHLFNFKCYDAYPSANTTLAQQEDGNILLIYTDRRTGEEKTLEKK